VGVPPSLQGGPPSHISHALIGPGGPLVTAPPPDSTYEAAATYVTSPELVTLPPPPSIAASQEEVAAIKQDVAHVQETLLQVHDVMSTRSFVAQTDFNALRATVQGLATQILTLTQEQRAVTRGVRQLDERRSLTEGHAFAKDSEHDAMLMRLQNATARLTLWKWIGGGVVLAVVNHLLTFYQPLAHLR
jgi:hypothetical protein